MTSTCSHHHVRDCHLCQDDKNDNESDRDGKIHDESNHDDKNSDESDRDDKNYGEFCGKGNYNGGSDNNVNGDYGNCDDDDDRGDGEDDGDQVDIVVLRQQAGHMGAALVYVDHLKISNNDCAFRKLPKYLNHFMFYHDMVVLLYHEYDRAFYQYDI